MQNFIKIDVDLPHILIDIATKSKHQKIVYYFSVCLSRLSFHFQVILLFIVVIVACCIYCFRLLFYSMTLFAFVRHITITVHTAHTSICMHTASHQHYTNTPYECIRPTANFRWKQNNACIIRTFVRFVIFVVSISP